jgi:16S rRNA processing protein RimM
VRKRPTDGSIDGPSPDRIVVAQFGAPHGVRGEIRLKSHTADPLKVGEYGPLAAADGREFVVSGARQAAGTQADMLVVSVDGVADRDAAAALNGLELSISRDRLPDPGDEDFYHADLVGLGVETADGTALGSVIAIHNHGAGDILEIVAPDGEPILVPFTKAIVPTVDIAGGRLVVDPPPGLLDADGEGGSDS